ncbi:MAG: choice-of-anchor Q domain-containing protein [Verrucomicrobiota bacterium]|nr:choice-of-anchor Q domain-containing protein [Verrucomicrobiota bacterium]
MITSILNILFVFGSVKDFGFAYTLSDYSLTKNVLIMGTNPDETIIMGPLSSGTSSNSGRMLNITAPRFVLSNVTLRKLNDDQPIISYNTDNTGTFVFQNLIFKDNNTDTKALIQPTGTENNSRIYLLNSLFHDNTALANAEMKGNFLKVFNNTIVNNSAEGIKITGIGDSWMKNNIIRGNLTTEIDDVSTGKVIVEYCNIEGGYLGALNSYDSVENFADSANDYYRLISSPGIDAGTEIFIKYDLEKISRPQNSTADIGVYEQPQNDNDADGLTNAEETTEGTNPDHPDSDADGLSDYDEINIYGTNPLLADTDNDFVADGDEPAIGMDPEVYDGICVLDMYDESFENTDRYPEGDWSQSIWGQQTTSYSGNIKLKTVGTEAFDGTRIVELQGEIPESYNISLIPRNGLEDYWIYWAFKFPRAKLPTNVNEAVNVAGGYMAINENGFLCLYDGEKEKWLVDSSESIPEGNWLNFTVHRNHSGKIVDVWVDGRAVFSNVPIFGIDLENFIRMSFSSVGEFNIQTDKFVGYPESPF